MTDLTGTLIGGGISAAFTAIAFVHGFGRLSNAVDRLAGDVGDFRVDATHRLDGIAEDVITVRERLS